MAELKNIRIAVSGIYDYALEELPTLRIALPGHGAPDWVEEKRLYKVYRPASVLAAACAKFSNLPLTHHHPKLPVDGQNFRDIAVGWTGEHPEIDFIQQTDEVGIRSTCVLYDDEALEAYERGEIQLSPGYIAEFEWRKGTDPHGNEYDIIMKEIKDVNHVALLPAGRGGEYAVVMDKAPEKENVFEIVRKSHENVDGAPKGNDNASKDHVKKEDKEKHYNESTEELKENFKKVVSLNPVSIDSNRNITDQKEAEQIFRNLGEVTNKSDGHNADFAVQSVGKLLRHKGFDYGKVFESAGELFANAQKVFSTEEEKKEGHKEHPNIKAYNNYVNKISLNGKDYYIRFTTREEYPGRKNPNRKMTDNMHSCAISEIALYETKKADSSTVSGSTPGGISNQPFIDSRLADFFMYVKQNQTQDAFNDEIVIYSTAIVKSVFDIVRNRIEVIDYGTVFDLVRVQTEDVKYEDGHVSKRRDGEYVKENGSWRKLTLEEKNKREDEEIQRQENEAVKIEKALKENGYDAEIAKSRHYWGNSTYITPKLNGEYLYWNTEGLGRKKGSLVKFRLSDHPFTNFGGRSEVMIKNADSIIKGLNKMKNVTLTASEVQKEIEKKNISKDKKNEAWDKMVRLIRLQSENIPVNETYKKEIEENYFKYYTPEQAEHLRERYRSR